MFTQATFLKLYRTIAILLVLTLFTIGSFPATGQAFPGNSHWMAHLTTYALIALFFGLGWANARAIFIALMVASIGLLHELTEIITHSHVFEGDDVIINATGGLIGVLILSMIRKFIQKT